MNLNDIAADDSAHLLDHSGETVIQRPQNVADDDVSRTGIFTESPPIERRNTGLRQDRRAQLLVDESITCRSDDRWQVRGEWWETDRIEGATGGLKTVHLVRPEDAFSNGSTGLI